MRQLFDIPTPDYLLVADKPLGDETALIRRISGTQEIFNELRFEYIENVIVTSPTEPHLASRPTHPSSNSAFIQQVEARLRHPLNDSLVVCQIDANVDHGVFALEPIECGDIVAIYAGQATCHQPAHYDFPAQTHALSLADKQKLIEKIKQADYLSGTDGINAALAGGIARFMNHAPTHFSRISQEIKEANPETLFRIAHSMGYPGVLADEQKTKKYLLEAVVRSMKSQYDPKVEALLNDNPQLASANLHPVCFPYKGFMLEALVAKRPIAKGQQLVWDYQLEYWRAPTDKINSAFLIRTPVKCHPYD